jgi:ADYC domain-containing protein
MSKHLAFPILFLAGCGVADPSTTTSDVGQQSATLIVRNGHQQNGHQQNGHQQNGHQQNGRDLAMAGVDLTTMKRLINVAPPGVDPDLSPGNLVPVPDVKLVGSMLTSGSYSGTQFAGHVVDGIVTDNVKQYPATFYIEKVEVSTTDAEIYHYQIRTLHPLVPTDGTDCTVSYCPPVWDYGCGTQTVRYHSNGTITEVEVPYQATAVGGQWNFEQGVPGGGRKLIEQGNPDYDTKITFACSTGAIGKCVENMGYKPWSTVTECDCPIFTVPVIASGRRWCRSCVTTTRELMHEACVRMVRADYCGDGESHTLEGISIDEWDSAGLQKPMVSSDTFNFSAYPDGYGHEAEWTPNGARCLMNVLMGRVSSDVDTHQTVFDYLMAHCPSKWEEQQYSMMQKHFAWADNDCFGQGTASQQSTWSLFNTPAGMDWHDRVMIKNASMCIVDRGRQNSAFSMPPCVTM